MQDRHESPRQSGTAAPDGSAPAPRDGAVAPDALATAFGLPVAGASLEPHGAGRIHASYRLHAGGTDYLLQRLNTQVFADVAVLARNTQRITAHLAARLRARGAADVSRRCLRLIPTAAGQPLHHSAEDGSWWCLFAFIADTASPATPPSLQQVFEAGRCFGEFLRDMSSLEPRSLACTIEGFHDVPRRLAAFELAVSEDPCGRASGAAEEIRRIRERRHLARVIEDLIEGGGLPERVVHYDCKLDNVLFDRRTGSALCVVDLDTVMPGCVLFDVGDLVRSAAGSAAEDGGGDGDMQLDLDRFEQVLRGYLSATGELLTSTEIAALAAAGAVVTYELALRFLTDHLLGDTYFRVERPGQNRLRAARQLALLASMERQAAEMERIVQSIPRAEHARR